MSDRAERPAFDSEEQEEMVSQTLLKEYGATLLTIEKGEMLFQEGDRARYFHVVRSGTIKMAVYNDKGREFVQGYFTKGQSFGEPPFFTGTPYPASAIAVEKSQVWHCPHDNFMTLLREHFEVHRRLTVVLSRRLFYKAMMLSEIAVEEAEHRITTLINYFRKSEQIGAGEEYRVPFTRQQLADMTGLRVETVIRTVKGMEDRGMLRISEGKIIWTPTENSHLLE